MHRAPPAERVTAVERVPAVARAPIVADDRVIEALREAIETVAEQRAAGLVSEARAEAEERVRSRLSAAFEASMIEEAVRIIGLDPSAPAPPGPLADAEPEPQEPPPVEFSSVEL